MRNRFGNILWGLLFIVAGIGYSGNVLNWWNFEFFFEGWWTLFIIVPCVISMIQSGIHVGNSIGLTIGAVLLLNAQGILPDRAYMLIWPGILVVIGVSIIFRRPYRTDSQHNANIHIDNNDSKYKYNYTYSAPSGGNYGNSSPLAIFGGAEARFAGIEFHGGSCTAVFGGVELDLRGAVITQDVTVDATAIFGGVDVFVDEKVQVRYSSVPVFGGTDCLVGPRDAALPTVFINSVAVFGAVDIK